MNRRIMHIDLDAFFVSVERADSPRLRDKPVVVGGRRDRRGVVAAASYEARAFGVHSAMPLKTAARLCPQAIFIAGNHEKYREVSEKFMAILSRYSPFLEPVGIDEAYIDATGFESIHGSARAMAEKIRHTVKTELGIVASIGIASSKVVAKVASRQAKPDGLLEVAAGREAEFLAPLEIARLPGVGKKTEIVLKSMGVTTLGKLAKMSPVSLKDRLGIYGEELLRYAQGIDARSVVPPQEAKSMSRETTFAEDTLDRKLLEDVLHHLSERVGAQLRESARHARCITLKLRFRDFTTITRSQTIAAATDADQIIFSTGLNLLRKEVAKTRQPVRLIGIGVSSLTAGSRQLDMLDQTAVRFQNLNRALDRIRQKYGIESIKTGRALSLKDIFVDPDNDELPT